MNFVKLYIGDYQRDTGSLSLIEHGVYLMMLQHYCATERPLPEGAALNRLLRATTKQEKDAVKCVVGWFWITTPEGLVNKRAYEEIEKARHQASVNRKLGKLGGRPRKTESVSESVSESEPNRKPNRNPNHSQITTACQDTEVGGLNGAKVVLLTGKPNLSTEYLGGDK